MSYGEIVTVCSETRTKQINVRYRQKMVVLLFNLVVLLLSQGFKGLRRQSVFILSVCVCVCVCVYLVMTPSQVWTDCHHMVVVLSSVKSIVTGHPCTWRCSKSHSTEVELQFVQTDQLHVASRGLIYSQPADCGERFDPAVWNAKSWFDVNWFLPPSKRKRVCSNI